MKSLIASTSVLGLALAASITAHAANIFTPGDPVLGGASDGTNFNVGVAGTAAGVNNWPTNEPPSAAIDGFGQKYLNFAELNTGILVTPSFNGGNGSIVTGITLWTANDAVERDPTSYQILGTNVAVGGGGPFPLSDFTEISSGSLALPAGRNAGGTTTPLDPLLNNFQTVNFTNSTSYKSYLVLFPTVTNAANANSMQIAEIQLDGVVPEPATAGLALLSLGALLVRRRR